MDRVELTAKKTALEKELAQVQKELAAIELNLKPYEAIATGYSGRFSTFFKTEAQARNKFEEYSGKVYFRNGLLHGTILVRHNPDGTETHLDHRTKARNWKCNCNKEASE